MVKVICINEIDSNEKFKRNELNNKERKLCKNIFKFVVFLWLKLRYCCLICLVLIFFGGIISMIVLLSKNNSSSTNIVIPITTSSTVTISPIIITTYSTFSTTTTTINNLSRSNWLINGDAETGPCETGNSVTHPTGWFYNGTITQVYYNNSYADLFYTDPGPNDRGQCYFYGEKPTSVTSMWQYVNMTSSIDPILIDNQTIYFNFSAWIGGYSSQADHAQVSLIFINQINQKIGSTVILGPVTNTHRLSITSLLFRQANGLVPIGARSCLVTVTITRVYGPTADGDVDNIVLYLY